MKHIDKIKKHKYKQARLQGKTIEQSLKDAGYSDKTARHKNSSLSVARVGDKEILDKMLAKDITVDWIVDQLIQELSAPDAKASDRVRVKELLGKYIKMFQDNVNIAVISQAQRLEAELASPNVIDVTPCATQGNTQLE